jgi:hypothetical protein
VLKKRGRLSQNGHDFASSQQLVDFHVGRQQGATATPFRQNTSVNAVMPELHTACSRPTKTSRLENQQAITPSTQGPIAGCCARDSSLFSKRDRQKHPAITLLGKGETLAQGTAH